MNSIIITGASRGIGYAVAEIFAKNGYNLFVTSRNEYNLYQAVEKLQTSNESITVHAKAFDLSVKENAVAFAQWCMEKADPAILVNNAGAFLPGNISTEPDGILEQQIATNLYSAYYLTKALLPAMQQNKTGHIFNVCSIASLNAYANGGAYSISKYALHGFSTNLREELKPHGIKVTSVFPGAVLTDSWEGFDNSSKRIMEATDIAEMIYAATQLSAAACVEQIILRPQLGDL